MAAGGLAHNNYGRGGFRASQRTTAHYQEALEETREALAQAQSRQRSALAGLQRIPGRFASRHEQLLSEYWDEVRDASDAMARARSDIEYLERRIIMLRNGEP